jgi:hypothetical protein
VARPSDYNEEIAAELCAQLAEGKSLRSVCAQENMPSTSSVFRWLAAQESFREQYARAKQESVEAMAEEIMDIADDGTNDYMTITKGKSSYEVVNGEAIQRSKLRVDTRKWLMSKIKPKKYGDRLEVVPPGGEALSPEAEAILSRVLDGTYTASPSAD